ncbi:calcium-binding protein, partial [Nostoc sp. FACHB-110]|uniref:calcium-binding protein n=1 Tax=Nostoc sp. FACHB-110 TaxID=2692834 RepID=UPI0016890280
NEGVDTINGGDGDDSIYVVNSVDQVDGGTGVDVLDIDTTSITSNVTILYTSASTGGTISDGITTRTIKNIEDARIDTGIGNDTINLSALASEVTVYGGAGNDVITGTNVDDSFFGDYLYGEAGNDTLNGGAGDDVLYGGTGFDRFVFSSLANGIDRIYDFSVVDDTIVVSAAGFGGGLVAGAAIATNQFVIGTAATTANQRFIYSQSNGALFFDRDGTGSSAQVQIASLSTGLALTNADIFVSA